MPEGWRVCSNVLKVNELNNRKKGHTRIACMKNVKCGGVGKV